MLLVLSTYRPEREASDAPFCNFMQLDEQIDLDRLHLLARPELSTLIDEQIDLDRLHLLARPELSTIITLKKLIYLPPTWHQCQKPSDELDPMLL